MVLYRYSCLFVVPLSVRHQPLMIPKNNNNSRGTGGVECWPEEDGKKFAAHAVSISVSGWLWMGLLAQCKRCEEDLTSSSSRRTDGWK